MKGWERTRAYPSIWRDAEPEYHIGAERSDELFCTLESAISTWSAPSRRSLADVQAKEGPGQVFGAVRGLTPAERRRQG